MIVSNSMGGNSTAGISSTGTSNNFIDNLFTSGNAVNFTSGGTTDNIVAYKAPISASGQNYFYPPLIDNQHTNTTIVNGMGGRPKVARSRPPYGAYAICTTGAWWSSVRGAASGWAGSQTWTKP